MGRLVEMWLFQKRISEAFGVNGFSFVVNECDLLELVADNETVKEESDKMKMKRM